MKGKLKKLAAIVLSMALMCSGMSAFADSTVNLVSGIVPTQNKTSSTGTLSTVTDGVKSHGNSGTCWFTRADYHYSATDPIALIFDLGSAKKVGKVVVTGSTSYTSSDVSYSLAKNYNILYSNDNSTWTIAKAVRDNEDYESVSTFSNITAQYWKIAVLFESQTSGERARICEIEMYEGEDYVVEEPTVNMVTGMTEIFDTEALSLSATASCESSEVTSVGFYNGTTKLADGVLTDGVWTAEATGLTAGEYFVTAKAETAAGGTAETSSVRMRVHTDSYTNIAKNKELTLTNVSGTTNPDCLVDGNTKSSSSPYVWATNQSYSSTNPLGATATIDLASGFDNEFLVRNITVYSAYGDTSTSSGGLSAFSLYYYHNDEWVLATSVTDAANKYTYVFPSEVVASKIKLVSEQSTTFRMREIEVSGKLHTATLEKTKTEIVDENGDTIDIFTAGALVYASASVTNIGEEDADITAILAVKENDGTLLAADLVRKETGIGATEKYSLGVEIPEDAQNARLELYWLDMATLSSWFDTEYYKSKELSPYSSDELVVSVESNGFKVYVKGSDEYSNNYVQYNFRHVEDEKINADLYRVYEAYAAERTGEDTFVSAMDGAKLLSNGELEFAVRELIDGAAADDFIGGFHGDENLTAVSLKLDGETVDLDTTGVYTCAEVEFVQESVISKRSQEDAANHIKSYTVDKNGIVLDQQVEWLSSIVLDDSYLCMLPVYRLHGDFQVTDYVRYIQDGKTVTYYAGDNVTTTTSPVAGVYEATVYSSTNGYSAYTKFIPGEGVNSDSTKFHIWVRDANDTKLYFRAHDGETTTVGEVWNWQNVYKLDLADANASASSASLLCSSEYDVNERAEVYVTTDIAADRVDIYDGAEKLGSAVLTEDGYFFA